LAKVQSVHSNFKNLKSGCSKTLVQDNYLISLLPVQPTDEVFISNFDTGKNKAD